MKQYGEEEIQFLVVAYNRLVTSSYQVDEDWIIYLLGEAYEYSILVKPFYKIPAIETISGNIEVFRIAQTKEN